MINRTEAERITNAAHAIRPDWPPAQLMTLIGELQTWPFLDLLVGLAYVAGERNLDGSWTSASPYRVKEQGPWRTIGIANAEAEAARRHTTEEGERRSAIRRLHFQAITNCSLCDDHGYLPNGHVCAHDPDIEQRTLAGAQLARQALQAKAAPE